MDIHRLNRDVIGAVRQYLGADDALDPRNDNEIARMSERELMDAYLTWVGIIGYTDRLLKAMECIKAAHKK